jgi:hypothetical protein
MNLLSLLKKTIQRPFEIVFKPHTAGGSGFLELLNAIMKISFVNAKTPIHFVNLFAPNFCGASLSCWQGTIEYKEDAFESLFNEPLSFTCLRYVCAGMEEGPELEERHMSLETFPFDEEPLMLSAFREDDRSPGWRIRRRPAYPKPNVGHSSGHSETV